jgi:hypothetical protein
MTNSERLSISSRPKTRTQSRISRRRDAFDRRRAKLHIARSPGSLRMNRSLWIGSIDRGFIFDPTRLVRAQSRFSGIVLASNACHNLSKFGVSKWRTALIALPLQPHTLTHQPAPLRSDPFRFPAPASCTSAFRPPCTAAHATESQWSPQRRGAVLVREVRSQHFIN